MNRGLRPMRGRATRRALLAAVAGCAGSLRAQGVKPLRLIVPFTPGGSSDILARAVGSRLALPGQTVLIDNRPGAGGALGAEAAAHAEPDGFTLLMGHLGTLAVNPSLYPKLAYDPTKSFAPVGLVARVPNVLVVRATSDIRSLADLLARAKARPGQLSYASGGNGSAAHITFEYLKLRAGVHLVHIPYRGTAPAVTDVLGGQVDTVFTGAPALLPHVKSGRLRALAVSSEQRLPSLPEVPSVAETFPGWSADQWYGLVAPAGTPAQVVARLNAALNAALAAPEVVDQLAAEGAIPLPGSAAAFGTLIAREIPRWREVVRAGRVRPD